jgi:SMC interacting uncharacterized protein involved in chromosome segregation
VINTRVSDDYLGKDRDELRAIIYERDDEIERLTRQRDSFEHQVDLKNEGLREQRCEIERLRAALNDIVLLDAAADHRDSEDVIADMVNVADAVLSVGLSVEPGKL